MRIGRGRWIEACCLAIVAALVAVVVVPSLIGGDSVAESTPEPAVTPLLPLDDAYIFVRFAQQLVRGQPLEWSDGVPSSGATSLVHLALLAPGQLGGGLRGAERWSQLVGWLTLLALGLAAARLLRAIGLGGILPVTGGATVMLSGPVAWGALAGMESALNAAVVLVACAMLTELWRLGEAAERHRVLFAIALLAALPLVRPENGLLVFAALAAALWMPAFQGRRRLLPLALVPGALLAALDLWLTGSAKPAGVLAKSITEYAFVDLPALSGIYLFNLSHKVLPVYLGGRGEVLWRPVGWIVLALAVAWPLGWWLASRVGHRRRPETRAANPRPIRLAVPLACWWILFLAAPLSAMVGWQYMRHHHAGLALAWVLAFAAAATALRRLGRAGIGLLILVPLLLLPTLPVWREAYAAGVSNLWRRHGPAAAWLAAHREPSSPLVLVNDAGYLAVLYDGPMIDTLGLGTPALARPYRHGAGALLEALARRPRLPDLAAVNRDVFHLGEILGRRVGPPPTRPNDTLVAEVRRERLRGTVLEDPGPGNGGLDFASLPDEERAGEQFALQWLPPPALLEPSLVVLDQSGGTETLQGCRPLRRALALSLPAADGVSVWIFAPPTAAAEVVARRAGGAELGRVLVPAGGSRRLRVELDGEAVDLRLERVSAGIPCLESLLLF